jgi:hypothetical protein
MTSEKGKEPASLESLTLSRLTAWLRAFLACGIGAPLTVGRDNTYRSDVVLDLFDEAEDIEFREKLRQAVVLLIEEWSARGESKEYFVELTRVAGGIRAVGARARLLDLVKDRALVGMSAVGINLQRHALRVLFGLGSHPDVSAIAKRDMDDPAYAPLCFRALWRLGLENGITYLPNLLRLAERSEEVDIDTPCIRFLRAAGFEFLSEQLARLYGVLIQEGLWDRFVRICHMSGYHLEPYERGFLVSSKRSQRFVSVGDQMPEPQFTSAFADRLIERLRDFRGEEHATMQLLIN